MIQLMPQDEVVTTIKILSDHQYHDNDATFALDQI